MFAPDDVKSVNYFDRAGAIGLCLSVIALCGLFAVGIVEFVPWLFFPTVFSVLLSIPGALISFLALVFSARDRKRAAWGLTLGILVCLYLPTIFLPLLIRAD